MNSRQTLVALLGLALMAFVYWTGEQRHTIGVLFTSLPDGGGARLIPNSQIPAGSDGGWDPNGTDKTPIGAPSGITSPSAKDPQGRPY